MAGIKEIVFILHFYNGTGTRPSILTAGTAGLDNRFLIFRLGQKVSSRCQIQGMVLGIPAFFQIVDIVGAILIIGHSVSDIRLADPINGRQKKRLVFIS